MEASCISRWTESPEEILEEIMKYSDSCSDYNEKFGHFCIEEFEKSERLRNMVLKRFVGSLTILASNIAAIIIITLTLACFIIFGVRVKLRNSRRQIHNSSAATSTMCL